MSEDEKAVIDGKLQWLQEHIKEQPEITVTYFRPDEKKSGGTLERHRRFTAVNDALAKTPQGAQSDWLALTAM